jgi:hypothetical protein
MAKDRKVPNKQSGKVEADQKKAERNGTFSARQSKVAVRLARYSARP